MPKAYAELVAIRAKLEQHYRDIQDIEFTIQQNTMYMLQTRSGGALLRWPTRSPSRCACEPGVDRPGGSRPPGQPRRARRQLLRTTLDPAAQRTLLVKGLPASPGAASGAVVFTADEAESRAAKGEER